MVGHSESQHVAFDTVLACEAVTRREHLAVEGKSQAELTEPELQPHVQRHVHRHRPVVGRVLIVCVGEVYAPHLAGGKSHTGAGEDSEMQLRGRVEGVVDMSRDKHIVFPETGIDHHGVSLRLGLLGAQGRHGVLGHHGHLQSQACTDAEVFNESEIVSSLHVSAMHQDSGLAGTFDYQRIASVYVKLGLRRAEGGEQYK